MAAGVDRLYKICSKRIAVLLRNSFWNPGLESRRNPFLRLPSSVIDDLITYVAGMSWCSQRLLSSDLQLLIATGRVRQFKLGDFETGNLVHVDGENLERILMNLTHSCDSLIKLNVFLFVYDADCEYHYIDAFDHLLLAARKLKHFESNLDIDLPALRNCAQLETLVLRFEICFSVVKKFSKLDQLRHHTFLKEVTLPRSYDDYYATDDSYLEIATLLKYCTELTTIQCDISKSLEHLWAETLHSGTLTHRYKIKKCMLGFGRSWRKLSASKDSIRIATLTCPFLQELEIYVQDNECISALADCRNLDALHIFWNQSLDQAGHGDYNQALRSLLEKPEIGRKLKSLELKFFTNVDFDSIATCCPNLKRLSVYYAFGENIHSEYFPTSFRNLRFLSVTGCEQLRNQNNRPDLYIQNNFRMHTQINIPIGVISSASNLEEMILGEITDDMFASILKKNSLTNLKNLTIYYSYVSLPMWRILADRLTALETLVARKSNLLLNELKYIFREVNPKVDVRSTKYKQRYN